MFPRPQRAVDKPCERGADDGAGSGIAGKVRKVTEDAGVFPDNSDMGKILVVDDSESVRKTLARALKRLPLEVWEADDGGKGLELVLGNAFELVITDYQMPVLDGISLIAGCRQKYPKLPFILISGAQPENIKMLDDVYFLQKPFSVADMMSLVRYILQIS